VVSSAIGREILDRKLVQFTTARGSTNPNIWSPRVAPSRLVRPFDSRSSISEMYLLA